MFLIRHKKDLKKCWKKQSRIKSCSCNSLEDWRGLPLIANPKKLHTFTRCFYLENLSAKQQVGLALHSGNALVVNLKANHQSTAVPSPNLNATGIESSKLFWGQIDALICGNRAGKAHLRKYRAFRIWSFYTPLRELSLQTCLSFLVDLP